MNGYTYRGSNSVFNGVTSYRKEFAPRSKFFSLRVDLLWKDFHVQSAGPVVQNLTTSVSNEMLKFLTYCMQKTVPFFAGKKKYAKASIIFSAKNIRTLGFTCTRKLRKSFSNNTLNNSALDVKKVGCFWGKDGTL